MALKDWKKIRNITKSKSVAFVTGYENKIGGHKIYLLTISKTYYADKNTTKRFHFRPTLISQLRQFKTKKQLVSYAKAYMRKH